MGNLGEITPVSGVMETPVLGPPCMTEILLEDEWKLCKAKKDHRIWSNHGIGIFSLETFYIAYPLVSGKALQIAQKRCELQEPYC